MHWGLQKAETWHLGVYIGLCGALCASFRKCLDFLKKKGEKGLSVI